MLTSLTYVAAREVDARCRTPGRWAAFMHRLALCAVAILGCDPGRAASFLVPTPLPASPDRLEVREAVAIATALGETYGLVPLPPNDDCPYARLWGPDERREQGLNLCVREHHKGGVEIGLSEIMTFNWGPRGDSLLRALTDTLRAHFGPRVTRTR